MNECSECKECHKWSTEEEQLLKLIQSTNDHDRNTCRCDGCREWWIAGVVMRNGVFMEIVDNPKQIDRDEWIRFFVVLLKQRQDKQINMPLITYFTGDFRMLRVI